MLRNDDLETNTHVSRLPAVKILARSGFAFHPSIQCAQIESRSSSASQAGARCLPPLPPGVGNRHLALNSLDGARPERTARLRASPMAASPDSIECADHPALLVVGEIGNLPVSHSGWRVLQERQRPLGAGRDGAHLERDLGSGCPLEPLLHHAVADANRDVLSRLR